MIVRATKSGRSLRRTVRSRSSRSARKAPSGRRARCGAGRPRPGSTAWAVGDGHQSRSSLPVSVMNTASSVGSVHRQVGDREAARPRRRRRSAGRMPATAPDTSRRHAALGDVAPSGRRRWRPASGRRRRLVEVAGSAADPDDGVGAERPLEPGRRVEGQDPAVVHDRHPVAELVGLLHVVRGEEDRLAAAWSSPRISHRAMRLWGSRPAVGSSRNRMRGRCMIARATISRWAMPPDSAMTSALARSARRNCSSSRSAASPGRLGAHPEVAAVEVEVLPDRQRPVERVRLGHDADDLLGQRGVGAPRRRRRRAPARGGHDPGGEHADGGGLAGAVGAEEPEDLTAPHREVEAVDGDDVGRVDAW